MSDENGADERLSFIPEEYMEVLSRALGNGRLGIVLVLDEESRDRLAADKPTMLALEDGGCIVLVPEKSLRDAYADPE